MVPGKQEFLYFSQWVVRCRNLYGCFFPDVSVGWKVINCSGHHLALHYNKKIIHRRCSPLRRSRDGHFRSCSKVVMLVGNKSCGPPLYLFDGIYVFDKIRVPHTWAVLQNRSGKISLLCKLWGGSWKWFSQVTLGYSPTCDRISMFGPLEVIT